MPGKRGSEGCAICGAGADDPGLLCLSRVPGTGWILDDRRRLPEPRLLVHPQRACLDELASRSREPEDASEVLAARLIEQLEQALEATVSQLARSGRLVAGHDVLVEALSRREVAAVLVAADAAPRTLRSVLRSAASGVAFRRLGLDRAALGQRIGQPPRAVVGVPSDPAASPVLRCIRRLASLDPQARPIDST